jgi:hypothetical protein
MPKKWYIQIFPRGTTKRTKNDYNTIEARTLEKSTIGINFKDTVLTLTDNILDCVSFDERTVLTKKQKEYRERQFKYFVNEMQIGDTVYLKKGMHILYQATISSNYIYDDSDYNIDDNSDNITNGWFWRHRRTISNITPMNEFDRSVMYRTIYKK